MQALPPELLVIGHASKDVEGDGFRLGGTVTYAGLLGVRLGLRTAVVTSHSPELPLETVLEGAEIRVRPSAESTTFRNRYDGSYRRQIISGLAEPLGLQDVPAAWQRSGVVLLGPVAAELRPDLFTAFGSSLLGLTPQGLMRAWTEDGEVYPVRWDPPDELLRSLDVLVLSEDDLEDPADLGRYIESVRMVAVTHAERGATIYVRGEPHEYPAYECDPTDPTGAGDVFAAAFLVELHASGDVGRAAHFANSAASFVIEAPGPAGVPDRPRILSRLARHAYRAPSPSP
jgi:hypothetical protein